MRRNLNRFIRLEERRKHYACALESGNVCFLDATNRSSKALSVKVPTLKYTHASKLAARMEKSRSNQIDSNLPSSFQKTE